MSDEPRSLEKICVATDFSENASLALDRAVELASHHGSKLLLVHIVVPEIPPVAGPEVMMMPPDFEQRLEDAARAGLEKWGQRVRDRGIEVEKVLKRGGAASAVVAAAREAGADMIVIGTRGNTGFKHLLLGSVAEEIVRTAEMPVLTVHPGDTRALEPVKTLLLPTDFSEGTDQALTCATALLQGVADAHIVLTHAYQMPPVLAPLWGFSAELPSLAADARRIALEAVEPVAVGLRERGFDVESVVTEGDAATAITDLAREKGVDLIALGTRGLSKFKQILLGSTAERVVEHAPCPVLTVHRLAD